MRIKAFIEATGLTRDAVRLYVRRGLLSPEVGAEGSNDYQTFDAAQVERALLIREGQALGFTLREIGLLAVQYESGDLDNARLAALMRERMALIDAQMRRMRRLRRYFADKAAWLDAGAVGNPPAFAARESAGAGSGHSRRGR